MTIICDPEKSREIMQTIRELDLPFDLVEERAFAPSSPDMALRIVVAFAQLLPVLVSLLRKLREKDARFDFETRHRLSRKMLADLEPLYWIKGKDTPEYSYYEYKTRQCKHFWELDRGEITHGPIRCS